MSKLPRLRLFDNEEPPEDFVADLSALGEMTGQALTKVLERLESEPLEVSHVILTKRVSKGLDLEKGSLGKALSVILFIVDALNEEYSLQNLSEDLAAVGWSQQKVTEIVDALKKHGPAIKARLGTRKLIRASLTGVLPTVVGLRYHTDLRLVSDTKGEIELTLPVAIIELTRSDNQRGPVFQLTEDEIDAFIEYLQRAKNQLQKVREMQALLGRER